MSVHFNGVIVYHYCMMLRRTLSTFSKSVAIACLLLLVHPGAAVAWGGYGYGYHHGYGHYGRHTGLHAHYSTHGGGSAVGYAILGVLSVLVLSQILDNDRYDRPRTVARSQPLPEYRRDSRVTRPYPRTPQRQAPVLPTFDRHEGWQALGKAEPDNAMRIFAIQSRQNLRSGVPKIGFALATAANGERQRAVWSMRRAIDIDPGALDQVVMDAELEQLVSDLNEHYRADITSASAQPYHAFMIAALSYLQGDIPGAENFITAADDSRSSNNLRSLINTASR